MLRYLGSVPVRTGIRPAPAEETCTCNVCSSRRAWERVGSAPASWIGPRSSRHPTSLEAASWSWHGVSPRVEDVTRSVFGVPSAHSLVFAQAGVDRRATPVQPGAAACRHPRRRSARGSTEPRRRGAGDQPCSGRCDGTRCSKSRRCCRRRRSQAHRGRRRSSQLCRWSPGLGGAAPPRTCRRGRKARRRRCRSFRRLVQRDPARHVLGMLIRDVAAVLVPGEARLAVGALTTNWSLNR
jgi:hypothetical protein